MQQAPYVSILHFWDKKSTLKLIIILLSSLDLWRELAVDGNFPF